MNEPQLRYGSVVFSTAWRRETGSGAKGEEENWTLGEWVTGSDWGDCGTEDGGDCEERLERRREDNEVTEDLGR